MDHHTSPSRSPRPRLTAQQAQQLLDEQALSDVGIMAFCRDHGVSYARLKYWRGRLATLRETSSVHAGFVEVVPPSLKRSNILQGNSGVVIRVSSGCQIEVSRGFDVAVLRAVVEALA
jgi:hypothetical protein